MKKSLIGVLLILLIVSCTNTKITITGTVDGLDSGTKVILNRLEKGHAVPMDTTTVQDKTFSFEIDTMQPQLLFLNFDGQRNPLNMFGGSENIIISGSIDDMSSMDISGGTETTNVFASFNKNIPGIDRTKEIRKEASSAQMTGDTVKLRELKEEYSMLMEEQLAYIKKFVKENTSNPVGVFVCAYFIRDQYTLEELQELVSEFEAASLGNHMYVVELKKALEPMIKMEEAKKATEIGAIAPMFSLQTTKGEEVSLDDFKGKIVLVDFWASTCRPCREENPNNVKLYKRYNSKGFEIISVSLDRSETDWKKAIEMDKLTWTQTRDAEGKVAEIYGVQYIPSTYLLDTEGKIIAKNLRGDELQDKLKELFQ